MLWIIQVLVASFVIIFVLHNLYVFFKDTLTVPKIKDMVKRPQQKYETLFRELRNNNSNNHNSSHNSSHNDNGHSSNNANDNDNAMKVELKRYLMDLNSTQQQPESHPHPHPQPQSDFIELGSIFN